MWPWRKKTGTTSEALPVSMGLTYCEVKIRDGLRAKGVEIDTRGICTPEWLERVREEAGGSFLTTRHPAILAAIEREINARLTGGQA